jgi:hypothetical protein
VTSLRARAAGTLSPAPGPASHSRREFKVNEAFDGIRQRSVRGNIVLDASAQGD